MWGHWALLGRLLGGAGPLGAETESASGSRAACWASPPKSLASMLAPLGHRLSRPPGRLSLSWHHFLNFTLTQLKIENAAGFTHFKGFFLTFCISQHPFVLWWVTIALGERKKLQLDALPSNTRSGGAVTCKASSPPRCALLGVHMRVPSTPWLPPNTHTHTHRCRSAVRLPVRMQPEVAENLQRMFKKRSQNG